MIHVQHLTKRYAGRTAIVDLNFEIKKGEVVGFLGPNGAGKSTTMKILTGYMPASEGTASIAGFDVFESPTEVKRRVGYLPETPPVYREMIVADYLEFAARLHGVPSSEVTQAVNRALEQTHLGDVRKRIIGNLSKGFRQRVGLAQALVHNPDVLILDEPTVGLDPKQIIEIRNLIRSLAADRTVILSTHILPEVQATCDRVIVINQGKIVAQDKLEQLSARLTQGKVYSLMARHRSAGALEALRSLPGVKSVALSPEAQDRVTIEIRPEASDIRDQIIETAVKQQMGVLEFFAEKLSLEEVFLQLTTTEDTA
ncbi:MAG: ABC transporter ATP-binding protein [Oligoflexia bacterium]